MLGGPYQESLTIMPAKYHEHQGTSDGNQVALVTGATGAIGKAIARQIATDAGYTVVLLCRDEQKGIAAVQEIKRVTGSEDVWYELADVSRKSSIQELAARWPGRLDVLVNNAAVTPRRRLETPEGIELQFATNVLGYFWMTQAFAAPLKRSSPSRVINVASYWAGGLAIDDLEFKRRRYDNNEAYRQSKQANRMLSAAFADRLRSGQVMVNACHPGDVNSKLSNDLGFGGHEPPDAGAKTPVWLATGPVGASETGKYFEHMQEVRCRFSADRTAVEALYEACLRY
jgi:NAD(P)-dependent dehydrogenase (short-subunit alcohol dehydrogenase family)